MELRLSPPGTWPPLGVQLYGAVPPVALSVSEYACPTVASLRLVEKIFSAAGPVMVSE